MLYYDLKESGERLKKLRKKLKRENGKKLRQEDVAEKLGVSVDAYRQVENGINGASIDTLILLAELYDTSVDYIVTGRNFVLVEE